MRVWCFESSTITMWCPDGVLMAPAWYKAQTGVLLEQRCNNAAPPLSPTCCKGGNVVLSACIETMQCLDGLLLAPACCNNENAVL